MCTHPEDPADAIVSARTGRLYDNARALRLAEDHKCGDPGEAKTRNGQPAFWYAHRDCAVSCGLFY